MAQPVPGEEIVRAAVARNPVEAHVWQEALEEEGIRCQIVGDYLDAGLGDIGSMRPEVWVHRQDLERARAVLARHEPPEEDSLSEAAGLLQELVRIPSVNPMGRPLAGPEFLEKEVTAYLEEFLGGLDVPYVRQRVAPDRDNIVAWFTPGGKADAVLLLEAHQDTVPAENMTIDPFAAAIENGRLYGRGACDIKGGMAAMLAAFARVVRDNRPGGPTVVMACVVDEEFTFRGIQELARAWAAPPSGNWPPRPDMAVVAEPTSLRIVNAHKGATRWHLHTRGQACHSSSPEHGVNAIYRMARVLEGIERFAERLRTLPGDPRLGPPTLSVGLIDGGVSVNTVPDRCRIEIDRRVVGGEDPAAAPGQLLDFLKNECRLDFPIVMDPPWMCKGALEPKGSEALAAKLGAAIDSVRGGHEVVGVPYGTDASTLAAAGIPSVVFGPGDIAQAHTADEWVDLAEVEQASEILYRLAAGLAG